MYEATVVSRIDLWLVNPDGKVAMVRRKHEPHADWWLPGGRFRPGLEPPAAASNQLQRDLGLPATDSCRLTELGDFHYTWGMPSFGITAQLAGFVWCGSLKSIEVSGIRLSPKYCQLAWCDPEDVAESGGPSRHPMLAEIARRALSCRR